MDELLVELKAVCEGEQLAAIRYGRPLIFDDLKTQLESVSIRFAKKRIEFNHNPLSILLARELTELWDNFFDIKSRYLQCIRQMQYIPEAQIVYAKYLCSGLEKQIPYQPTIGLELFKHFRESNNSKWAQFSEQSFNEVFIDIDLSDKVAVPKIDMTIKGNKNKK